MNMTNIFCNYLGLNLGNDLLKLEQLVFLEVYI